jgi:cysteinyl-tRNA synthetase
MKLHNTLSRTVEEIQPLNGKKIGLYACGLTVYSQPHIGNWVAYIYWDTLVRTLRAEGFDVTHVQNITDVGHLTSDEDAGEDKMLKGALKEGKTAWEVAEKYIEIADREAYERLNLTRPTHMPRATEYIQQQIDFVRDLEAKGYTYLIEDGVYFDTSKLKDYGELARLDIEGLQFGARVEQTGKKNPTDFAVWKFSPIDQKRDMEWESPWGKGFPGWHLECSVMARELLGDQIDIHTGGIDHIPVHHTNEIAQSEAVTGKKFVNTWVHANHIKVDGRKMSKSLGNIYTLDDIESKSFDLMAFKLLVLGKHYSTEGNFTWDNLAAAHNRLQNWKTFAVLRHQIHDTLQDDDEKNDDGVSLLAASRGIIETLSNNLDTPSALRIIDEAFDKLDNVPLASIHRFSLVQLLETIDDTLGLQLQQSTPDIGDDLKQLILQRQQAREAKDWTTSDTLRDELLAHNIAVRDTPQGTIWQYK